jgi:hypothetical protein
VRGGNWNYLGVLHKSRCTTRGGVPRLAKYSEGSVVMTDYLISGIRVVLTPDVDLYPPEALAERKAERDRYFEQQKKLQEEAAGRKGGAKNGEPENPEPKKKG